MAVQQAEPESGTALSLYRQVGARLFDRAARETGMTPIQLRTALKVALLRPTLTAPTLRAWRRGNKPVPLAALLAVCDLAGKRPAALVAMLRAEAKAGGTDLDGDFARLLERL